MNLLSKIYRFLFFILIGAPFLGKNTHSTDATYTSVTKSNKQSLRENKCCPCLNNTVKLVTVPSTNKSQTTEIPSFQLPDSVWPMEYRLSIKLDFNNFIKVGIEKIFGNVSIKVLVKNLTNAVHLHTSENLVIKNISIRNENFQVSRIKIKHFETINPYVLKINLNSMLQIGEIFWIEILEFESLHQSDQEAGILTRKYQSPLGKFEHMLATQFQPESARMVFPCFDEPRFKSKFQMNISTNAEYTILNNMPHIKCQKHVKPNLSDFKTCIFDVSPIMPVYNLAFAIVNFKFIEKKDKKGRTFRIWTRGSQIDKAQFALDTTIKAFNLFEKKFKIDFPLKKIDSLAIPNLKGFLGMEHYGLITYDEPVLIWNEKFPLTFSKLLCVSIVCHEVAHQWFGNLVTTEWWKDLWLNEGFATFYSHMMAKEIIKDDLYYSLEHMSVLNYVRNFDDYFTITKSTISAPVYSYVESKFNYLSYKKGFIIVSMLQNILGTKSFDHAIRDYIKNNQYNYVSPSHLWTSINKYSKIPMASLMNDWLNKICYPIVQVGIHKNSVINLKQNSSINFSTSIFKIKFPEFITNKWKIPLFVIFGNNTFRSETKFIIFEKVSEFINIHDVKHSDNWMIINVNYSSLFTTDYDDVMFCRIRKQMLKNHLIIPPINRAQIMQDYYDLSKKYQRNNLKGLLKLFSYIQKETDPIPLLTAINLLNKLNGLFEMRSFYPIWHKYVTKILQSVFVKLVNDFETNFTDPNSMYLNLRRDAFSLACKLKLDHCFNITLKIIERWKNNKMLKTDYDLLHVALCKYIEMDKRGENWQNLYSNNQFQSWDFINVKYYAMGCTRIPWVIEKNIDIAYNVLKNSTDRKEHPHVSPIIIDNIPADYLHGTTSLSTLLVLSSICNFPNSINFLIRFNKDGLSLIYSSLQYPPHFPLSKAILEYAIPTLSHYNFISYLFSPKYNQGLVILRDAKSNIDWILKNEDLEQQLQLLVM